MTVAMSTLRTEFENYARSKGWRLGRKADRSYRDPATQRAWFAFREARRTAIPANDIAELRRFGAYLEDKGTLPPDEFAAKWADYEAGKA